jgi:hypothetical protein
MHKRCGIARIYQHCGEPHLHYCDERHLHCYVVDFDYRVGSRYLMPTAPTARAKASLENGLLIERLG